MIQSALMRMMRLFPSQGFHQADIDEFNRQMDYEYERIRDFLILHYKQTARDDSPMWDYCRNMQVPATLRHKMDLFRSHGLIFQEGEELFTEISWFQVMNGQGIVPQSYDPLVDQRPAEEVAAFVGGIERVILKCVEVMPAHEEFIAAHCAMAR